METFINVPQDLFLGAFCWHKTNTFSLSIIKKIQGNFWKEQPPLLLPWDTPASVWMHFSNSDVERAVSGALEPSKSTHCRI